MKLLIGSGILCLAVLAFVLTRQAPAAPQLAVPGQPLDDAVRFTVKETSPAGATERTFEAEFRGNGDLARFGFAFVPKPIPESGPAAFTTGTLSSRAGSQTSALIFALARAHEASSGTITLVRQATVPLDVAYFGDSLQMGPGGGTVIAGAFTTMPPGPWIVLKLFVPNDGEEPGELFLALNPEHGEGLFLVKDPEYWPLLELTLASVL